MNSSDLINSMNAFTQNLNAVSGLLAQADYSKRNWKRTKEMWDMQTSYNSQMVNEARQWQEQMYNTYNTPAAQVEQLKSAGLNPLLMMSGKGSTGGIATNTSTGNAGSPSYSPQRPDFSGAVQSANMALQNMYTNHLQAQMNREQVMLAREQANNMRIKNTYEAGILKAEILEKLSSADVSKETKGYYSELAKQLGFENQLFEETFDERKESYKLENDLRIAEIGLRGLQAEYQALLNKWLPAEKQADLALKAAQEYQAWQAGALSKQQAIESVARTLQVYAVTVGQNISNWVSYKTAQSLVDSMNANNKFNVGFYGSINGADPTSAGWLYREYTNRNLNASTRNYLRRTTTYSGSGAALFGLVSGSGSRSVSEAAPY